MSEDLRKIHLESRPKKLVTRQNFFDGHLFESKRGYLRDYLSCSLFFTNRKYGSSDLSGVIKDGSKGWHFY